MSLLFPSIRRYKYAGKKALFMFETGSIKKEKGGHLAFQKVILYHYGSKYSIVVYQQVWPKVVKHVVFWPESHYSNIARNIALSIAHKTILYRSRQTFLTALS